MVKTRLFINIEGHKTPSQNKMEKIIITPIVSNHNTKWERVNSWSVGTKDGSSIVCFSMEEALNVKQLLETKNILK